MEDLNKEYEEVLEEQAKNLLVIGRLMQCESVSKYLECTSKNKFDDIKEQAENLIAIGKLMQSKSVVKYLDCLSKQKEYTAKVDELYKKIQLKKYANCNHILVISDVEHDYMEGRSYKYYGCVRCGFNSAVANRGWGRNKEEKVMLELMNEHKVYSVYGIHTDVACGLSDGKELWKKVEDNNKDLSDNDLVDIFKKRAKAKKLKLSMD